MTLWYIAAEDAVSLAIAEKMVKAVNKKAEIMRLGKSGGNAELRKNLGKYNDLARLSPVLLLTDLDNVECAPSLLKNWFSGFSAREDQLIFRVAIREVESWLLADRHNMGVFLGVPVNQIPLQPDMLADPKQKLLQLTKRYAQKDLKADLVRDINGGVGVGFGYNARLSQFIRESWDLNKAVVNSDSLNRAYHRLLNVKKKRV